MLNVTDWPDTGVEPFMTVAVRVALLVLVDLALALLGRINSQLQLLTLAFPVKMLAALGVLVSMAALFPTMFRAYAGSSFQTIHMLIRR